MLDVTEERSDALLAGQKDVLEAEEARRGEPEVQESAEQLTRDLSAMQRLQETSTKLIREEDDSVFHELILDAAVDIMRSDFASIQMLYPERGIAGELRLLGHRGFSGDAAQFWEWVRADSQSTCGEALHTGRRSIATDVATCAFMAGSDDQRVYLDAGIRAVQSTPLISRSGAFLGMLSTHWREPHVPSERDLQLFDVLARQAADFIEREHAAEALRAATAVKDEFLGLVSHELRTPLTMVMGNAEILVRQDGRVSDADRSMAANDVLVNARRLERMVDAMLALARLDRGQSPELEPVSLRRCAEGCIQELHLAGTARDVTTDIDPALFVWGHSEYVEQVIYNLLGNAAKYSEPGSLIEIEAAAIAAGQVVARVMDRGQGIADEDGSRLFLPFERGTNVGPQPGLGVGLTVCKRLVEAMGGQIAAYRRPGGGSVFELTLRRCGQD